MTDENGRAGCEVAIVLSGSIVPAVSFVAVTDVATRRGHYLDSLRFYREFGPVFFLENSSYDLLADPDFTRLDGVQLRKFSMLPGPERGKGYQEFAMLDAWRLQEHVPPARFLKVTGRYRFANVARLLEECVAAAPDEILIDRFRTGSVAITSLFSIGWRRYLDTIRGLYREMDDSRDIWAEHVVYRALAGDPLVRNFAHEPDPRGISGTTAERLDVPAWKRAIRQVTRSVDRAAGVDDLRWRAL
jgi:hypothetical protein